MDNIEKRLRVLIHKLEEVVTELDNIAIDYSYGNSKHTENMQACIFCGEQKRSVITIEREDLGKKFQRVLCNDCFRALDIAFKYGNSKRKE